MPLCEALSSHRGRGPHHVHKDRVGTWELSCLTTGHVPTWSASGRRGVVADDARAREVGLRHSVCLTVDASGGLKSRSARGPEPISEGGGNASPAREDGRYGEATEAQRRKLGNG